MKRAAFSKVIGGLRALQQGAAPWLPPDQQYPRLLALDPKAVGAGEGVYAVWHLGVRPQWLRVGATANLAAALAALPKLPWIAAHEGNAGIFVAWAHPTKEQQLGIVRFLADTLKPAYQHETFAADLALDPASAPVTFSFPPGTRP